MFDKLFQFIRDGVKNAILQGFADAQDELAGRIEAPPERYIEADVKPTNGRKRTAASK